MRAVLLAVALFAIASPGLARADMVGPFDPELASICGGNAHNPRCPADLVGLGCCGAFGMISVGVILLFTIGRRKKP